MTLQLRRDGHDVHCWTIGFKLINGGLCAISELLIEPSPNMKEVAICFEYLQYNFESHVVIDWLIEHTTQGKRREGKACRAYDMSQ